MALLALAVLVPSTQAAAKPGTKWLCKPGLENDPCRAGLSTTLVSPEGTPTAEASPERRPRRRTDCFYVYPTVSDQDSENANLDIDPELRSIALYQAARYSQQCRVYAPVYPQVTLAGLGSGGFTEENLAIAYRGVRRAWRDFNELRNRRRGVVLIGHSQGTYMLERLISEEIDPSRSARRRLVMAILLGGGVTVDQGSDRGGSFERIRACESARQLRCVIGFATFNAPVPDDAIFGRTADVGEEVLCTNPAALGGGVGRLRSIYPSEPFAPGTTIGLATNAVGVPVPDVDTAWFEARGAYDGRCSSADGADVLQIEGRAGAPVLNPVPNGSWGLHLVDANIALGNLVRLVGEKTRRYARAM